MRSVWGLLVLVSLKKMQELKKMSDFKLLLRKKLRNLRERVSNQLSREESNPSLLNRYTEDKNKKTRILGQIKSNKEFREFLLWYIEEEFLKEISFDTTGEERAKSDGKALAYYNVYKLLTRMNYVTGQSDKDAGQ
jgi:hypothetical protein